MLKPLNLPLLILILVLAPLNLGIDGHRKWKDAKCDCAQGDPFKSKILLHPPELFLNWGEIELVLVECGLEKDTAAPIETAWDISSSLPYLGFNGPGGPASGLRWDSFSRSKWSTGET